MFNFFVTEDNFKGDTYYLTDDNYNHIVNVLRMKKNDTFLVSCSGTSDLCKLISTENGVAIAEIIEKNYQDTELPIKIHLYQGLPKSDKLEFIIQKCVELGVTDITPVEMSRCVVKIEDKKKQTKQTRWQAIAESAAKQSKRNIIPAVHTPISFRQAISEALSLDILLVPYENKEGMTATVSALELIKPGMTIGIFIGPEGGFDEKEIDIAKNNNGKIISLGKRILRTETAAVTAVGMCMLYAEAKLNGDNNETATH